MEATTAGHDSSYLHFVTEHSPASAPLHVVQTLLRGEATADFLAQRARYLPSFSQLWHLLSKSYDHTFESTRLRVRDFLPSTLHTLHGYRALRTSLDKLRWQSPNFDEARRISYNRLQFINSSRELAKHASLGHCRNTVFLHREGS